MRTKPPEGVATKGDLVGPRRPAERRSGSSDCSATHEITETALLGWAGVAWRGGGLHSIETY